ncbi:MAG TPA: kynureninase [Gemmatimonadales bacterium]|nr:kynureninase [Gemmatimonadales bacterium]
MSAPARREETRLREFPAEESWALEQDAADEVAWARGEFELPPGPDGRPLVYLAGNSLGLIPRAARALVARELDDWARLGVEAHLEGRTPWYSYHERLREPLARLVGAGPGEVVAMNSLTVNLHLMLVSFFRPAGSRCRILIEDAAFPSDRYAVVSHLESRGLDPADALLVARPRAGEAVLRTEDVEALLAERGAELALVLLGGVHYYTGQLFEMARIARAARRAGAAVGFDLAHAAGNAVLQLHDWDVDFAVWCSYKYLNGGPGAVGGAFVHARHAGDLGRPRYAGWWGNDPRTRFEMHRNTAFVPVPGADGWQLSNPPILSMAPLRAALDLFDRAGMAALRAKSERLTGYLEHLVERLAGGAAELLTPRDPAQRGCQLSLRLGPRARAVVEGLRARGVVADFREPDVIRLAPTPLYNTFHEVWRTGRMLSELLRPE